MQNPEHLQRIRDRAFALYLARQQTGQETEGSELEDWLRAEKELADTVRTARPQFTQSYGGDGMSSGPEPETPDPATLQEATATNQAGDKAGNGGGNGANGKEARDRAAAGPNRGANLAEAGKPNNDSARRRH